MDAGPPSVHQRRTRVNKEMCSHGAFICPDAFDGNLSPSDDTSIPIYTRIYYKTILVAKRFHARKGSLAQAKSLLCQN
jgi:hypothetical protein